LKLEQFFSGIERRELRIAELATSHREHALDLVQDAMLTLVERYADRDESEWGPLFHRILQNRIKDWYRHKAVRSRWQVWFGTNKNDDDYDYDPIAMAADVTTPTPDRKIASDAIGIAIEKELSKLPLRQQQAFLLRAWEGLSVAETAFAMGCAEGSVKTHYSRAVHRLRESLGEHWE
jgi:RNA polymerase sigma-70 factor (ECF subfamily)